jgi:colanic acid/amylovoran biosynthesis protein
VLPVANHFKTKEMARRIGIADVLLDIDTVTPQEAREKLGTFVANLERYRRTSLEAVLEEHASAMTATGLLRPLIAGRSTDVARDVANSVEAQL